MLESVFENALSLPPSASVSWYFVALLFQNDFIDFYYLFLPFFVMLLAYGS